MAEDTNKGAHIMVLASHHIIKEMLNAIDKKDFKLLEELGKKFRQRYIGDDELQQILDGEKSPFEQYILTGDEAALLKLKAELHRIWNIRQLESAGGEKLWYKDRRP